MVEIAPLPAGFPPPAEVPTPTPRPATAHPLEAWAEPGPTIEPVISRSLPGGGYLSATRTALDRQAAELARNRAMTATVKHGAEIAQERREREAQAETARKAASDPVAVLRQAHKLHAEAAAEVERLRQPLARARDLFRDVENRERCYNDETEALHGAAADALVAALAGDGAVKIAAPRSATVAQDNAAVTRTAQTALDKLEAEHAAARDRLERCRHGISRCAVNVLVDEAADLAAGIEADHAAIERRRSDLDALAALLTNEGRHLNGTAPHLPAAISRAIYPAAAARALPATDWVSRFRALCEAPADPLSDAAEDGPQHSSP